jgi:hypothetical protein
MSARSLERFDLTLDYYLFQGRHADIQIFRRLGRREEHVEMGIYFFVQFDRPVFYSIRDHLYTSVISFI